MERMKNNDSLTVSVVTGIAAASEGAISGAKKLRYVIITEGSAGGFRKGSGKEKPLWKADISYGY